MTAAAPSLELSAILETMATASKRLRMGIEGPRTADDLDTHADTLRAALQADPVAVAWQFRFLLNDTGYWSGWTQVESEESAVRMVGRHAEHNVKAEWRALYTAAPAAVMPDEIDPDSPNFKQGMAVGRAESEMLCRLIADPKCEHCGARNEAEAETMCRPSGDSCPGTEWPLVNLWALNKPTDEAPAKGAYPSEGHECHYDNGDGPCGECSDLAVVERIRKEVEAATVAHCDGGDLWLTSNIAAKKIAALTSPDATP